jgi:hypothetical protein
MSLMARTEVKIFQAYIERLETQLALSKKREDILREGLEKYADTSDEGLSIWEQHYVAVKALKKADELK